MENILAKIISERDKKAKVESKKRNRAAAVALKTVRAHLKREMEIVRKQYGSVLVVSDEEVEKYAAYDATIDEMAAMLNCHASLLLEKHSEAIARGRERGNYSLKFKAFEKALSGDNMMLMFLLKQKGKTSDGVKYNERPEIQNINNNVINIIINEVPN